LSPVPGLRRWAEGRLPGHVPSERSALQALAAHYLTHEWRDGHSLDPVARFHLGNGARLERINAGADASDKGAAQSFGLMVNYVYDLGEVERNHEEYVKRHRVACSGAVERLAREGQGVVESVTVAPVTSP
jgi:malonyl-CoA decarboxylase